MTPRTSAATSSEIVQVLMQLYGRLIDHQGDCLERLDLTYAQGKVVWHLAEGETLSLKRLAERLHVDPSNLSASIDRLVARGVVAAGPAAHDRRVRGISITPTGLELREQLILTL